VELSGMNERFDFFGGIDFSGAREPLSNLWTAVGREEDGKLLIVALRPHAFRADLCGFVAGGWRAETGADEGARILWGADFPFGLPRAATDRLELRVGTGTEWEALLAWVADRPADEVRDALADHLRTPRHTDTGGALAPMDLRLYKQTVEGLRWLHELRDLTEAAVLPQAPRADADTTIVEVYPSAAAHELGLPKRRAPGRPGETRARAAALRTYLGFADPSLEATAVTLEDAWDATVACVTAWLCRSDLEQPRRAGDALAHTVACEGWIFAPPGAEPRSGTRRKG
jgi:hypothetical protein